MIRIIAGGKKHASWLEEVVRDYARRLRRPYDINWVFMEESKLEKYLNPWPFTGREYVICCDERGQNISSREYSDLLTKAFLNNKDVIILIGGAYGFSEETRKNADFVWSFSNLVFPHMIARLIAAEQTYRASEIAKNSPYHHE